jgi:hypothetical protein
MVYVLSYAEVEVLASLSRRWGAQQSIIGLVIVLSCLRLAHVHLLWADEDYHLAAAINLLHGKVPYRDFWYDKPPLSAFYYLLIGGFPGWPLRFLDAAYIGIACYLAYRLANHWWSKAEGYVAACLLAFFTTFYLPSAVIPFAADAVMLAPHLAAIYLAYCRKPVWAGVFCGIAFLANAKALFVLAACAMWLLPEIIWLILGFALPVAAGFLLLFFVGAWPGYVEQVWRWGLIYAKGSPVVHPFVNGIVRTSHWIGFHAVLALGAVWAFLRISRDDRWKLGTWLIFSFAAVALGSRFAPHYFLQLLPPLAIAASRGLVLMTGEYRRVAIAACIVLLAVPFIRFGPHYFLLALDNLQGRRSNWSDVQMDLDSQEVARQVNAWAKGGDTLLVWGYRPDVYVYTRMVSDSRFWDSQPLTGVPADRHLSGTTAIYSTSAALNREELLHSRPTWIIDGLGRFNPKLKPSVFRELKPWLAHYKLAGGTKLSWIYRRIN